MSDHRPFDRPWASRVPPRSSYPGASTTDRPAGPAPQGSRHGGAGGAPSSPADPSPAGPASDSRASAAARGLADGLRAMTGDDAPVEEVHDEAGSVEAEPLEAEPLEAEPVDAADTEVVDAEVVGDEEVPGSSDSDDLAEAEAAISSDFQALAKERDEYLEALRRLQADFENYKKRMMRQQTATLERAAEDLVSKLLPVLDTIDLARQHGGGEAVDQVAASLLDVLGKEGLERIAPAGKPFDPNEHEAVAHQEGDGEPKVVDVMRVGYRWRGRLLRPAMVSVKG